MTLDTVRAHRNLDSTVEIRNDGVFVRTSGDLATEAIEAFGTTLRDAVSTGRSVVVDLSETRFCCADAADVFLAADAKARARRTPLEFRSVLPPLRALFERHALDWRIRVTDDPTL